MSGLSISTEQLGVRFKDTQALQNVSVQFDAGAIHGLLGRNGSGKTTLLSTIAALRRPTTGAVLVGGEDPFENERIMGDICMIRESGDVLTDEKVRTNLDYFADVRRYWDADYAGELLEAFELSPKKRPDKLSRGQRSALGVVLGLASRSPVTLFDEVHLGMDAPSRYRFYDLLLADYVENPRTIVLSSHLISEIEQLFAGVTILHSGRVLLNADAEDLRARGASLTGAAEAITDLTAGLQVLSTQALGPTQQTTVFGDLDPDLRRRAKESGVEIGPVPLQDLFVHLTSGENR
ncbi:ATP-binding cassette domain-containing protein [Pseudactinotalea sp. Z1739]|uniref:ATP-binding cassette domain-containing protein n=1 Tax=Pseudactinotalea sp. Z1739 TaxID=3413028 RepID=UPI003C7BA7AD